MNRKNNYQCIEFLRSDDDDEQPNDCRIEEKRNENSGYLDVGLFTPSQSSSSPPKDFDINFEPQYIPIFNENESQSQEDQQSSSLASSLSIESHHDYVSSPNPSTNTRVIRCSVCEKPMRTFYCAKCIQKGQYVTIDSPFMEKLDASRTLKDENSDEEVDQIDEQKRLQEILQIKQRSLIRRTEALKSLYNDQKLKLEETENLLRDTKHQLDLDKRSNKSKEGKIELIKRYIASRKASVKKRREAEKTLIDDLKLFVSRRIYQLTNDVFSIEEIDLMDQNNSFVNMETSPLLTFSAGSYHQIENQTAFSIVEPWLPSNGDYSAYSLWVNDNQDHIPASMSELSERNPAFRIGAGLAYTMQLVKNLAYYLDVILPTIMDHNTFSGELLNDAQFSYNVAKLNANVIHLCVSQGVDVSLLNPQRTLKNLMLLLNLNISDLGRKPVIEIDNEEAVERIEEQLTADLSLNQEEFYDNLSKLADEDDMSDSEWEISDNINPMEMQLATEQSIQQNSYISRLPMRLLASFWSTGS